MLEALEVQGNAIGRVTLHVGAGTFLPVRTDDLSAHEMHAEGFEVSAKLAQQVTCAREQGRAVVAVGTTVVRALESAADRSHPGHVTEKQGDTRLLIQPGYHFSVVDALLTNFHAPRSTLLALVAAFIGQSRWREAYRVALADKYRFLSYGDAMWLPQREADVAAVCSEGGSR
jgi:S-adenosylmethionine:tRNA ribosyltransferase-isomerase